MFRDPDVSFKAKGLLGLLLSNESGAWVSHQESILQMSPQGKDSLQSALKELEIAGYLMRVQYVDKELKRKRGSFWAYTDVAGEFEIGAHLALLETYGLEVQDVRKKGKAGSPKAGSPYMANPTLRISIDKNTKKDKESLRHPETSDMDRPSLVQRTDSYIPLAARLADIIKTHKRIIAPPQRIRQWANAIRKLVEQDGVDQCRIEAALDWYSEAIGGQYIPVIESGQSLREKFSRLEDAMKRAGVTPNQDCAPKDSETSIRDQVKARLQHPTLVKAFMRSCVSAGVGIFSHGRQNGQVDRGLVVQGLLHLYDQIEAAQRKNLTPELRLLLPGSFDLIAAYIAWIEDNDWINYPLSLKMLDTKHSLFDRFCGQMANNDNLKRDPLTGKSRL